MNYRNYRFSDTNFNKQNGTLLVGIVISITTISILAASALYLTTGSNLGELFSNNHMRAYYLAESGGNFAIPQIKQDHAAATTNLNNKTFILSGGDKFFLSINDTNPTYTLLESTGITSEGKWFESRRKITYKINKTYQDTFSNSPNLAPNWTVTAGSASIKSVGPSDKQPALNMKGTESLISLGWDGNSNLPDLVAQWNN